MEAAPSQDGVVQTVAVSSPRKSAGMACQTSTHCCKSTMNPQRSFLVSTLGLISYSFVFTLFLFIKTDL